MTDSSSFNARAVFTFAPDRFYRVELRNGFLYFLRIGGQFDSDRIRGGMPPGGGLLPTVMMLAASKALSHKNEKAQLIARDPSQNPEELLSIHPDNFRLTPSEIKKATFRPKKWFPSHGPHVGRLIIEQMDGKSQEYQFENDRDMDAAMKHLSQLLGEKVGAE
jgi:hypothetical protein